MLGGLLADRYDKRRILFATQSIMIAQAAVLGLLDVTGAVQLWHVYLLAAVLGVTSAIDVPVRQSFVVEMVGGTDLPNAVSLNSVTFNLARIVGPALAGVLIVVVGTGWVFLGNAVFTIAVIVGLALMRTGELFRSAPTGRTPGQLREGLRYVRGRSELVLPMVLVFVVGTFGLNYPVTMALLAKEVFGRGAAGYGLFTTAIAVGSLGGALMSTRWTAAPRTRLLLSACFAFGLIEVAGRPDADVLVDRGDAAADGRGHADVHDRRELHRAARQRPGVPGAGDGALHDVLHRRHADRRPAGRGDLRRARRRGPAWCGAAGSRRWPRSVPPSWSAAGAG